MALVVAAAEAVAAHRDGPRPRRTQYLTLSRKVTSMSWNALGKLHSIQDSGWFLAIPFVDQIAYAIDVRERAMDIPPQAAITRDNVSVEVSGNLFIKFQDAQAAAYGALNPLYSVTQVRYDTLRYVTLRYVQIRTRNVELVLTFGICILSIFCNSMPNRPCDRRLEKWNLMKFCMAVLV